MISNSKQSEKQSFAALLCHFSLWFGLVCATPVFIAINNSEDIVLSTGQLGGWATLTWILLSFFGWKIAESAGARFQWWLSRILLAIAFVLAIQGNVIHDLFYYGAFNGEAVNFRKYGFKFWAEWWGFLLAFPFALLLLTRLSRLWVWLPALPILSFLFLVIPALLSIGPDISTMDTDKEIDSSVFAFSTSSNLIHLLPDGFQGDVVREVLQQNPDLAAKFEGFTLFTDHLGMYQGTAPALYTILTGEPFEFEKGFSYKRIRPIIQAKAYQNELAKQGYQLDYVPISSYVCIKDANSCHTRPFNDMKARGYFRHHSEDVAYSAKLIADLTLFRLLPMFLKEKIYANGQWFLSDTGLDGSSPWPDPVIREWVENMYVDGTRPVYKWYHFIGTHIPPHWDKNCHLQRNLERERENYKSQAYCVLSGVGALLDRLKQLGIFDQTAMLISGDHGHNIFPDDMTAAPINSELYPGMLGSGRPALLVKQMHSRVPLQFSDLPTSLVDVAPTALALVGIETEAPSVFDIPEQQTRVRYYTPYSIRDFWSGEAIPYVRYRIEGAVRDGEHWVLSDIRSFREPPTDFDPVNLANAEGQMMGASLSRSKPDNESSWITGRQLGFLINLPEREAVQSLELTLHLPQWIPAQSFTVQLNNAQHSNKFDLFRDEAYWQKVSIPLDNDQLVPGRNFISILFERTYSPPDKDNWQAAVLLKSIKVSERP